MTFWSLRSSGVTFKDAALVVGISNDSSWNQVYERGWCATEIDATTELPFLSLEEREFIADGVRGGWTMVAIPTCLG